MRDPVFRLFLRQLFIYSMGVGVFPMLLVTRFTTGPGPLTSLHLWEGAFWGLFIGTSVTRLPAIWRRRGVRTCVEYAASRPAGRRQIFRAQLATTLLAVSLLIPPTPARPVA